MKYATTLSWMSVIVFGVLLGHSGCGRDAFVVVQVSGASDEKTQFLALSATIASLQGSEVYSGHPDEVSFFLPAGSLGDLVNVKIDAWSATCILATGNASGNIENRPRLDLSVQLSPTQLCP